MHDGTLVESMARSHHPVVAVEDDIAVHPGDLAAGRRDVTESDVQQTLLLPHDVAAMELDQDVSVPGLKIEGPVERELDGDQRHSESPAKDMVVLQPALETRRVDATGKLAAELVRVVRLGADAGLALLPFKGAVLACDIYGDVALRQFADVDLLVDPLHSAAVEEFLRSLGYESRLDFGWEAHFVNPQSGLCVDLHRGHLTPEDFPVPELFTRFWARRVAVRIDEQRVEAPCIDDLLIILCIQAARDAWQGKTRLGRSATSHTF
jgi:hypothetical protein